MSQHLSHGRDVILTTVSMGNSAYESQGVAKWLGHMTEMLVENSSCVPSEVQQSRSWRVKVPRLQCATVAARRKCDYQYD